MQRRLACFICFIGGIVIVSTALGQQTTIRSPDGSLAASLFTDSVSRWSYEFRLKGKSIIAPSPLGIIVDGDDLGRGSVMGEPVPVSVDESYRWKGVHDTAINRYKGVLVPFHHRKSGRDFQLELRVFDNGFAFRYIVLPKGGISTKTQRKGVDSSLVNGEATGWKLPAHSMLWYQENVYYYEGLHDSGLVDRLGNRHIGPPATFRTPDGLYGSITEAALYNYSGMSLRSDSTGTLYADFVNDPMGWRLWDTIFSPWRVVIAGEDLNTLVNADIIQDLNPAPAVSLADAAWIRPGRAVWSYFKHDNVTKASIERDYVDKAARLGFEYSVVDAGWEGAWPSKWDTLRQLVEYSNARKVGIWVWKSYSVLKNDTARLEFFRKLQDIGVAGVKIDYIDKEGIDQVRFYEKALEDAAQCHLLIDFHGADKPTGYERRFPNELTREAIYGQEWRTYTPKGPTNNVILPFTRFLAGPGDYTPGVFNSRQAYGVSRTHQLALPIIYNSPLMCWAEDPVVYLESPAVTMIRSIPTVWDETRVLPFSRIGEIAAFARRKGKDWFIGIIHAGPEKHISLPLNFLGAGHFDTQALQDDLSDADHFLYSRTDHMANDSLSILLRPDGGYAGMLLWVPQPGVSLSINPAGGYLTAGVKVRISAAVNFEKESGIEIRYTRDGSEPVSGSELYTRPFTADKPILIRSHAFRKGKLLPVSAVAQFLPYPPPLIFPETSLFTGKLAIRIKAPDVYKIPGVNKISAHKTEEAYKVIFTIDGSEPVASSPVFRDSLVLDHTVRLRTSVLFRNGMTGAIAEKRFVKVRPSASVGPTENAKGGTGQAREFLPGLRYSYYEGKWQMIPDLKKLESQRTGVVDSPALEAAALRKNYYCIDFSGYIELPETGVYTFYTLSDDGSRLFIDDRQVVNNDGCHGDLEKSGEAALSAGKHPFRLLYFQYASGQTLKIFIKGLGMNKQEIPASLFSHRMNRIPTRN